MERISSDMPRPAVTTVILAGGLGTRIGGEKGLKLLHGRPLIGWVLDSVRHQSAEILINANGELDPYSCFGYPIIADQIPGWPGPLAGLQVALRYARHDWVVSVPCDTPFLPDNLISGLYEAVSQSGRKEASVVLVAGRRQPTIALYHKSVLLKLDDYLLAGGRKVNGWLETLHLGEAQFDNEMAFKNINTPDDLVLAKAISEQVVAGEFSDLLMCNRDENK